MHGIEETELGIVDLASDMAMQWIKAATADTPTAAHRPIITAAMIAANQRVTPVYTARDLWLSSTQALCSGWRDQWVGWHMGHFDMIANPRPPKPVKLDLHIDTLAVIPAGRKKPAPASKERYEWEAPRSPSDKRVTFADLCEGAASLENFAALLGISTEVARKIKNQRYVPGERTKAQIASVLGLQPDDIRYPVKPMTTEAVTAA